MEKFITDERAGLRYKLVVGDSYLIVGQDEQTEAMFSRLINNLPKRRV